MIRIGQIYESCQPTILVNGKPIQKRIRIRVVDVESGVFGACDMAVVVTLTPDGRAVRCRTVEVTKLHASRVTANRRPRRTGYYLIRDTPEDPR